MRVYVSDKGRRLDVWAGRKRNEMLLMMMPLISGADVCSTEFRSFETILNDHLSREIVSVAIVKAIVRHNTPCFIKRTPYLFVDSKPVGVSLHCSDTLHLSRS